MAIFDKDIGSLYDEDTLEYWKTRYPDNVRWNFDNLLLRRLTPDELQTIRKVRLEFPLVGHVVTHCDPFAFYSYQDPPTVTLPILSIKFLDDLSIASAWLELNGFSQETIMDYISMLKYADKRRFPSGKFPSPLEALNAPDNVLENHQVDELAQKLLKSSLIWILAHELGHILFKHRGYSELSPEQAQGAEREADEFATEIFRRIGVPPVGMAIFFVALVHWLPNRGDFGGDAAWKVYVTSGTSHPVSTARLKSLADSLRSSPEGFSAAEPNKDAARQTVIGIAEKIEDIVEGLEPRVQRLIQARALTITPESLAPRRLGEAVVSGMSHVDTSVDGPQFNGMYYGIHTRNLANGGTESLDCCLLLNRKGNAVTGRFSFGMGEGTLNGRIVRGALYFDWEWSDSYGRGVLQPTSLKAFSGRWGYKDRRDNGGTWTGSRD